MPNRSGRAGAQTDRGEPVSSFDVAAGQVRHLVLPQSSQAWPLREAPAHPGLPQPVQQRTVAEGFEVVSAFAPGITLAELASCLDGLDAHWVTAWAVSMLEVVSHLHANQIVLGCLQPDDVVVGAVGLYLVDSRWLNGCTGRSIAGHVRRGAVSSARAASGSRRGAASDLFSIGSIAFWLLTGQPPLVSGLGSSAHLFNVLRDCRPHLEREWGMPSSPCSTSRP